MKHSIPRWQLAGFVFTGILGTFLHFLFDLSGENAVAALFSAVNESIWEHMKLLFYPMVVFALMEYGFWGKEKTGFWCVKLKGIMLGLVLIPVLYYTYTGILGTSADWFNVTIFFLAAAVAYWWETKLFTQEKPYPVPDWAAIGGILLLALVFSVLTFLPPQIPFFEDPVTGTFGFYKKATA